MRLLLYFLVFWSSCCIPHAWSETFYVDNSSANASDSNVGDSLHPLKTISRAAHIVKAGDTVFVKNGVYRESIVVENSGSSFDRMITFKAGKNVVIKGSDVVTGWKLVEGAIWKKENWTVNSQQVFVDGTILSQIGGNPYYSPKRLPIVGKNMSDMFPGSFYFDPASGSLYVWLVDGSNPNAHIVEASVRPWLFYIKKKRYIKLSGFIFQHSNTTALIKTGWPAVNISGDDCIVENNSISWCDFTGLGGYGNNLVIRNNTANYNGNSGMSFSGTNIVMDNNKTNYNNYRKFDMNWQGGGMKNTIFSKSIIRYHVAKNNLGHGIWCDIDCKDVVIESSKAQQNDGMGIFYEISNDALIKNNITTENKQNGIYISASNNCKVLNNIAYANIRGIVIHGVPRANYTLTNNLVENNILVNNLHADLLFATPSASAKGNSSDYNLFYQSDGILKNRLDYTAAMITLLQWQKNTGFDKHSLVGNPRFKSVSNDDFEPTVVSLIRGKGNSNPQVKEYFDGMLRGKSSDIGPFNVSFY